MAPVLGADDGAVLDLTAQSTYDPIASYGFRTEPGRTRYDGWSAEKQRVFLQAMSEGSSITNAARAVGMSTQSAYALRRSARGAAFALGWQAAQLLAREALADKLMERALNGVTETFTYRDGSEATRHRHDNRLAMAMLTRMDRAADAARNEASHSAARMVAAEFDQYLALIEREAAPARAGLFLGARLGAAGAQPAGDDDLEPVRALARADRWLRTHTDLAEPLDTADLDPAARADWTADQWARAEAAGLVQLAPPPPPEPEPAAEPHDGNHQLHQLFADPDNPDGDPVWWNSELEEWRTSFPPPEDFDGDEEFEYGDDDYNRALSETEDRQFRLYRTCINADLRHAGETDRDAWFAALLEEITTPQIPPPEGEGDHGKAMVEG